MKEPSVAKRLYEEPYAFDFFQAVRLLHQMKEEAIEVGEGGPPSREVVRFCSYASLAFPASAIYDLGTSKADQTVPRLVVTFMGLFGLNGALPRHYTEMILRVARERRGEERHALRDWFDLFNHRFISLFYRAWAKYRFWLGHDRSTGIQPDDTFNLALRSLVGLGTDGLNQRLRVVAVEPHGERERVLARIDDPSLMFYAGLFAQRKRNAAGLQSMLADYFRVPVKIKQFIGHWLQLEPENQSRLGLEDGNCELGMNSIAGERVYDVQGKFRVCLGPLTYDRFVEFLPDQTPLPEQKTFFLLTHLVRFYVGPELDFDIQAILLASSMPECQLSEEMPGPRLGWNTWLTSQQPQHDAEDALFPVEEVIRLNEVPLARI